MSSWNTYGVSVTDESVQDDVISELESLGLEAWRSSGNVKATDSHGNSVGCSDVQQVLSPFIGDGVSGLIHVTANDTADNASGEVYKAENGSLERLYSDHSGGQNTRSSFAMYHDGVHVNGGRY